MFDCCGLGYYYTYYIARWICIGEPYYTYTAHIISYLLMRSHMYGRRDASSSVLGLWSVQVGTTYKKEKNIFNMTVMWWRRNSFFSINSLVFLVCSEWLTFCAAADDDYLFSWYEGIFVVRSSGDVVQFDDVN